MVNTIHVLLCAILEPLPLVILSLDIVYCLEHGFRITTALISCLYCLDLPLYQTAVLVLRFAAP